MMIKFVPLTHGLLRELGGKGYNLLKSTSKPDEENPTYQPVRIPDVWAYLTELDTSGSIEWGNEPRLLVIQDVLDNIREEDLRGVVLID